MPNTSAADTTGGTLTGVLTAVVVGHAVHPDGVTPGQAASMVADAQAGAR